MSFLPKLVSFLPYYCHSFRIIVIPSRLLSFLPDQCHSFRILSFLPNYYHFKIFIILNSSGILPYPKDEKNGHRRWPYMRVLIKFLYNNMSGNQFSRSPLTKEMERKVFQNAIKNLWSSVIKNILAKLLYASATKQIC